VASTRTVAGIELEIVPYPLLSSVLDELRVPRAT
jgi:hypothetical protein